MALPGPAVLAANILALPPASDPLTGGMNFAKTIADYMSLISAGPTGSPGILTYNSAVFGPLIAAMPPDSTGATWGALMAANWQTGLLASIITPGTVVDPTWTSSGVDILTIPSAAATCITAPAATALLATKLADAKDDATAMKVATAYHEAIMQLQFLCIGLLLAGVVPTPTPIPKGAM
jgi:hypothetical protein